MARFEQHSIERASVEAVPALEDDHTGPLHGMVSTIQWASNALSARILLKSAYSRRGATPTVS